MIPRTSVVILLFGTLVAAPACAHPRLLTSNPAPNATLKAAPKEIRMTFSEGLIANFTGLELRDGKGKAVPTGKAALASGNFRTFTAPISARLAPGNYTVAWHAVSVDTHRVSGTYVFKVTP